MAIRARLLSNSKMAHSSAWEHKQKSKVAGHVAEDSGALEACAFHPESLYKGSAALEAAQELARRRYEQGALYSSYTSVQELLTYVKQVVVENDRSDCAICARIRAEGAKFRAGPLAGLGNGG